MEEALLNPAQEKFLRLVGDAPELKQFYLSGGTALAAYYLKHRRSDDLDFFIKEEPDSIILHAFVQKAKEQLRASDVRYERLHDRNIFFFHGTFGELKVEFTKYPFSRLGKLEEHQGIRVDSLRDIAVNKLMAMLDRFDPKDFVDLFFILKKTPLAEIRRDAERKFEMKADPVFLGGEFMKVDRIAALPKMVKPLTVPELQEYFHACARELEHEVLK